MAKGFTPLSVGTSIQGTVLVFLFVFSFSRLYAASPCHAVDLRCEYLVDPLGIDTKSPRLTWRLADERRGAKQLAFQVLVSLDSLDFLSSGRLQWNSGKVTSSWSFISYGGKPLQPFARYYWKVILWDKDGMPSDTARVSVFEMGMMGEGNWKGAWISDGADMDEKPAPLFRKTFDAGKKVVSARAYIAVAGLFELFLNGKKVGDHRLDPAYTRFDRRTLYIVPDGPRAIFHKQLCHRNCINRFQ